MSELAIEISNLSKTYSSSKDSSQKKALHSVNLQVKKGSFFGLLGPNGAGKSTIINILAGLTNKNSGLVKISDLDIEQNPQAAKYKIGIVPQEVTIDPFFTVYETLENYAGYYGIKKKDRKTKEIIKALGLEEKANVKPRSLSGGMKRRLLIAKALVHSPEILVLDEPTAGVDVNLRNQLWDYVKDLNKSGTTILLTTHYLEEAEELCDEIAIINRGEVITHDSKDNLMNILSKKELIISYKSKLPDIDNLFKSIEKDIETTTLGEKKLSLTYDPQKTKIDKILKIISKNHSQIEDISTSQPDLEAIFKFMIK